MTDRWIPAPRVAAYYGVKTATLAKWRKLGKGPGGWRRLSATRVVYPESEVQAFEVRMGEIPAPTQRPPVRTSA